MATSQLPDQGRLRVAEAVLAFEQTFGRDDLRTLAAVRYAGDIYADQGRPEEAEAMHKRALEGYLKTLGQDHISTITTTSELGILYAERGRLVEAEVMLDRALQGFAKTRGRYHQSSLNTVQNLGLVYAAQGRLRKAEEAYKIAIEEMQKALGPANTSTLIAVNNLGLFYQDQNRFDEAEVMYKWALQGFENTLGRHHKTTLTATNGLGMLRRRQGKLKEAEELFKEAMNVSERTFGRDCTLTLDTICNLGNVYADQAKEIEAEEMYKQALRGLERVVGWDHKSTLNTANNLRLLYVGQNKLEEAEEMSRRICGRGGETRLHESVRDRELLHRAVRNRDIVLIQLLLDNGFPINAKSQDYWNRDRIDGSVALCVAAFHGFAEIVIELLARGADVDAASDSLTPLTIAALRNHLDIAHILLDHGAKVNGIDGTGICPLVEASARGHLEMARLILQRGAHLEAPDSDGDPALHSAAQNGHVDIVGLLLDYGADPKSTGGSGRTARWFASEAKHEAVAQLLRDRGADDQNPPDIPDDSSVALQSIGIDRLLADMEEAQSLMCDDTIAQQWARKLWFIIQVSRDQSRQYDLELIEEEPENTEPFIAVSYCWGSVSSSVDTTPLMVRDPRLRAALPRGSRPTRAQPDVILRSFGFAASRGIKRIWIDQECIDQDDEADVQAAVQSMHVVYQRAAATVVVLGRHVHTAEDISGLPDLKPSEGMCITTQPSSTIRDRILGDKWFTRAWCAQEHANSPTLYYLVGWRDGLDEDGRAWKECARVSNEGRHGLKQPILREWVIPDFHLRSMAWSSLRHRNMIESMVSSTQIGAPPDTCTLLDDDVEKVQRYRRHSAPRSSSGETNDTGLSRARPTSFARHCPARQLRSPMSCAYVTLGGKRNLLVSDRLAILGNMTRYAFGINTRKAADRNLSYTACVMALALRNGDLNSFSFLAGGNTDPLATNDGGNATGSWLPPPTLSLDRMFPRPRGDFRPYHFAGHPGYVVGKKGLICGLIWEIEAYDVHGFSDVRDVLPELFKLACDERGKEWGLWIEVILQVLIRHFMSAGYWELAELIILCALQRQLKDPEEVQSLLSGFESWARDGHDENWPSEWHIRAPGIQPPAEPSGPNLPLSSLTGGRPLLHWVCERIASNKPLPIGKCLVRGDTGDARILVGMFAVDPTRHRKVFTPLSELEYEFGSSHIPELYPRRRLFGAVEEMEGIRPSDEDIAKAVGFLSEERDSLLDPRVYRARRRDGPLAVWSHRLLRNGILEMNDQYGWMTIPLGQAAQYRWIS